jgi:hypothetical protein
MQLLGLILVGVAVLLAALFGDGRMVLGVVVGGGLASANFFALRRIIGGLMEGGQPRRMAILATLLTLKFGLLAVLFYVAIRFLPLSPIGLLGGITVVVLAILVEGLRAARLESTHERA